MEENTTPVGAADDDETAEYYTDALTGQRRKRRGKQRRHSRGPMSLAEKNLSRAFQGMLSDLHHMDGELADLTAKQFTAVLTTARIAMRAYSFEVMPNPGPEDWQALRDELWGTEPKVVTVTEQFDVGLLK